MTPEIAALLAGLAVFFAVYGALAPRQEMDPAVYDADPLLGAAPVGAAGTGVMQRYVRPMVRNLLPQTPFAAQLKTAQRSKIAELLVRSGNPWRVTPEEFVGIRLVAALAGLVVGLFLGVTETLPVPPIASTLGGAAVGYIFPKYLLDKAKSKRLKAAQNGLPEALDLLRITLNSGQNFVPALSEVSQRLPDGIVRQELSRVAADMRAGRPLKDALTDLARRLPSEDVESFVKAVLQTERLGSDVSHTLQNQSHAARAAYEARLDKRIGSLPNTLFVPIIIFMIPSLFLVILAPALAQIAKTL